ncbi:TadE family type IV pilus minor pilin [Actinocrispum sp. NPDC049592]|uniref:TadE family type IV pilus minor pilin n=1 Tax=Actinocrispum sp. NPDC049592 TaxID=3154835 RepID=UPI003442DD9B
MSERGAVTVEAAIALCSLALVLYLALAGIAAITTHLRCVDAAREAARLIARGEPTLAQQAVAKIAPSNAHLSTTTDGDHIQVEISASTQLPGLTVTGKAFAIAEPTETTPE